MCRNKEVFMSLMNDLLFKEAFAHKDNRKVLEYFLETMLDLKEGFLQDKLTVTYEKTLPKKSIKDKSFRGDVLIQYEHTIINLEAYTYWNDYAVEKSLCYIMRIFSARQEHEEELEKVIQVNVVDKKHKKDSNMIEDYQIINTQNNQDRLGENKFLIKIIHIDKARNQIYNEGDKKLRWLKFIGATSKEERAYYAKGDKLLMEFKKWLDEYVFDEKTKKYFQEWDYKIRVNHAMIAAEEKGMEKGAKEANIETAKKMLAAKEDLEKIQKFTDLSIDEIKNIKETTDFQ